MAAFELSDETGGRLDYALMQGAHVVLFWRSEVLASAVAGLTDLGYRVVQLDAGTWHMGQVMHEQVAAALDFPDYYGHNLDALSDCLRDVCPVRVRQRRRAEGLVLVLDGYDAFVAKQRRDAEVFTEIFAAVARQGLLLGHRMLCLLRVEDARFSLPPTGATPVLWNPQEWLDSSRR
jgi:RNAse (barnase) inhibitor barstar